MAREFEPFLVAYEGKAEVVRSVVEPALALVGLELIQLHLVRGAHRDTLRLFVDRRGVGTKRGEGVSMADLERANRTLSDLLDVEDQAQGLFGHAYDLEVGSPGVDRPLTKRSHFGDVLGERAKIKTTTPITLPNGSGARTLTGTIVSADDSVFGLRLDDGATVSVGYDTIEKANVVFVFEEKQKPGQGARGAPSDAPAPKKRSG